MSEEKTIVKKTEVQAKPEQPKLVKKSKIAIILIRGFIGMNQEVKDTLYMLRLRKKHTCVVIENNDSNIGMIKIIKDYVAYGEIDESTLKELVSKRGKEDPNKKGRTKPFFELHPPRGGFERKGIKKAYRQGGALGNRGEKINELIKKML